MVVVSAAIETAATYSERGKDSSAVLSITRASFLCSTYVLTAAPPPVATAAAVTTAAILGSTTPAVTPAALATVTPAAAAVGAAAPEAIAEAFEANAAGACTFDECHANAEAMSGMMPTE